MTTAASLLAILATLVSFSTNAQDRYPASPPDIVLIERYAQIERARDSDPEAYVRGVRLLLEEWNDWDLRLDAARVAFERGLFQEALDILDVSLTELGDADPIQTEIHDLRSAAHAALGNHEAALNSAFDAYDAAVLRLGNQNPSLLDRLAEIEALIEAHGLPDLDLVLAERDRLLMAAQEKPRAALEGEPVAVTVWYGTNRAPTGSNDVALFYGPDLGELSFGKLTVTIPPGHVSGALERPSLWPFTSYEDPRYHVVLAELAPVARSVFAEACCGDADRLLFIHGFNNSFHTGALRAAQLAHDLEFRGTPLYFSWPSRASTLAYWRDSAGVVGTRMSLIDFLDVATQGSGKLHVIAHSMGNRYFLDAVEIFLRDFPDRHFGQVILAAPDVTKDEVQVRMPLLKERTDGVTLYASSNDWAMKLSHRVNGVPRAGDIVGEPLQLPGLITMDASEVSIDLFGHDYIANAPQVLADLYGVVRMGWRPDERCAATVKEDPIWQITADGCRVEVARVVGDVIELYGEGASKAVQVYLDDASEDEAAFWREVMEVLAQRLE